LLSLFFGAIVHPFPFLSVLLLRGITFLLSVQGSLLLFQAQKLPTLLPKQPAGTRRERCPE